MERKCYNCSRKLDNEPCIKGVKGFLCFVCRYNFDKVGGERFFIESQIYQEKQRDWEIKHKDKWIKYQRCKRFANSLLYLIAIFIFSPFFLSLFEKANKEIFIFCLGCGICFIIIRVFLSLYLPKIPYIPPPMPPRRDENSLFCNLDVVYDKEIKDEHPEFLKFSGYPPDWEERQKQCLARDGYKCRVCGKAKMLHIHHVKPISYGGIHGLQNLITLCNLCHKKQKYYQHENLIMENIKACRKYWVSPHIRFNGKRVSGYFRKTGRRGIFWRRIRRVRS